MNEDPKVVLVTQDADGGLTADAQWLSGSPPVSRDSDTVDEAVNKLRGYVQRDPDYRDCWPDDMVYEVQQRTEIPHKPVENNRSWLCAFKIHDWAPWEERDSYTSETPFIVAWIYVQKRTCRCCGLVKMRTQEKWHDL